MQHRTSKAGQVKCNEVIECIVLRIKVCSIHYAWVKLPFKQYLRHFRPYDVLLLLFSADQ